MIHYRLKEQTLILPVRVTPKRGRDSVLPFQEGDTEIRLKVSAPPEDGKANTAVVELLAKTLKLPKSRISIAHGETSRHKQVAIVAEEGASAVLETLAKALNVQTESCFSP